MRTLKFTFNAFLFLLCTNLLWAEAPDLEPGVFIKDGSQNLEVNLYSAPTSADWNNDGAKDLVVGQIWDGYVWLYLNQGTNLNPLFNGGSLIESDGSPIAVTWG